VLGENVYSSAASTEHVFHGESPRPSPASAPPEALMNHDVRVRQGVTFLLRAAREQHRAMLAAWPMQYVFTVAVMNCIVS